MLSHLKKSRGYTLTEIIITISIIGISLAFAGPPLQDFVTNNKMTSSANKLVSAIILARNEAVTRRTAIRVTGDDNGWQVLTVPLTTAVTPTTLASYTLGSGMLLRVSETLVDDSITFTPDGFRKLSDGPTSFFFTVCSNVLENTRKVTVNAAGTTTVEKGSGGCPDE